MEHVWRRLLGMAVLAGCDGSVGATARDAVVAMDAMDVVVSVDAMDAVVPMDATAMCAIAARGARALRLSGQATYFRDAGAAAPESRAETLLLYLPLGRAPGAPLIVGFNNYEGRFIEVPGMFDAQGALDGLRFYGIDTSDVSWTASMAAPDGPLALRIQRNFNTTTDVRESWEGTATLCPAGDAPGPTVRPLVEVGPVGPWRFGANAPLSRGAETISLRADGAPVAASVRWELGWLTVTPARGVAPGAAIVMDLAGVRDPVGRTFSQEGAVRTLATSAVVTDRTFDAAPPTGAVTGGRAETREGALWLSSPTGRMGPWVSLVALGEVPAGSVTVRYHTRYAGPGELAAWLVRGDGTSVSLPIELSTATDPAREANATIGGSGPLWLQVADQSATQRPGWLPRRAGVFAIDAVRAGM